LSLERVLRVLNRLGFSKVDAEVYVFLAKIGPQKGRDLTTNLKIAKQQLYPILKVMQKKGIVTSNRKRPSLFSAIAFEELLDLYVKTSIDQAQIIIETKEELLANWRNATCDPKN